MGKIVGKFQKILEKNRNIVGILWKNPKKVLKIAGKILKITGKILKIARKILKIAGRNIGYSHGWKSVPMVRINIPTVRRKIPMLRRKFPHSEKNSHALEKFPCLGKIQKMPNKFR